ncbi:MAG: PspC domain-containing protein [Ruminococcus sp.]|jgi:phage shock protein PspC (stress-responsive transcriptional regulator)|nr:PspC domain-containing protein [Ruminococcus sp.]
MKKLAKSSTNKMISGVCAGIANYFSADPTLIRVLWAIASLVTGGITGIIAYIIMAVIMPYDNEIGE